MYKARSEDVPVPVLEATLESNRKQIEKAFGLVQATGKKQIGVLGLSFKAGTDDMRESPMVTLIEMLIGKGFQLAIYDPYVTSSQLIGANREYIEREIPHIWELMRGSIGEVLSSSDAVIIGNSASEFREIEGHLRPDQPVVDLVRAFGNRMSDGVQYQGICW